MTPLFFGTQAVRLLREVWPNATQLAQELYAMLDDNIPQTNNAPVTINQQNPHEAALTINNSQGGNSLVVNGGDTTIGGDTFNLNTTKVTNNGNDVTDVVNNISNFFGSPGGGGHPVYLGRVVSGGGNTYRVEVYGNGSSKAATATVAATVPQIDPGEVIPAGTWIAAVHEFPDVNAQGVITYTYEFQPPVWLNG